MTSQDSDRIIKASRKIVEAMDRKEINVYVTLAKAALWFVSVAMCILAGYAIYDTRIAWNSETRLWTQPASILIQSLQVLAFVSITVFGLHEYRGSRILHILRNWDK